MSYCCELLSVCCLRVLLHVCCSWLVFCFQAEDGIRDLVRSRGLGDVYKRQVEAAIELDPSFLLGHCLRADLMLLGTDRQYLPEAVSYTHLTLPPSDLG